MYWDLFEGLLDLLFLSEPIQTIKPIISQAIKYSLHNFLLQHKQYVFEIYFLYTEKLILMMSDGT